MATSSRPLTGSPILVATSWRPLLGDHILVATSWRPIPGDHILAVSHNIQILLLYKHYLMLRWDKIKLYPGPHGSQAGTFSTTLKKHWYWKWSVFSYTIKSWDNSQVEPETIPRLNLGKIPAIAGKTKLGQNPAIAEKKPCHSRDFSGAYIFLLWLVMFPAIARNITRPPNAFITV